MEENKMWEKNFVSQCEPILESIRNLTQEKKTEEDRGEIIVYNYFDKELIDKRSKLVDIFVVNEWEVEDVSEWLNQIGFGDCN